MKTAAEKSSTTTASRSSHSSQPFFGKADGGDFFAPAVQAKLTVGKEGDKYEQEADMMAERAVQRAAMPNIQSKCAGCDEKDKLQKKPLADGITPFIQRKEMEEEPVQRKEEEEEPVQAKRIQRKEEEEEPVQTKRIQRKEEEEEPVQTKRIQRKEEEQEEPVQAKRIQRMEKEEEEPVQAKSASGPGRPDLGMVEWGLQDAKGLGSRLSGPVQQEMESGFGVDMGEVRIHTDQAAADMSQMLHAQAFTHGWDVFFNQHKYNPNTRDGKLLLAHELAHTLQQAKANGALLRPAQTRMEQEIPIVPDEGKAMQAMMEQAKAEAEVINELQAEEALQTMPKAQAEGDKPAAKPVAKPAPALPKCKPPAKESPKPAVAAEGKAPEPKPEAVPEQAPKCPANDPDFAKAKKQIARDAKKQCSHEPAAQKRAEMVASAALPTAEQNLQSGQEQQAANLEIAAKPKPFDRQEFKRKLKEKIESKMPENEDQAKEFADSGKLEEAKEDFKGTIGEEKVKVSGPLEQTVEQSLPAGQDLKPDNVAVPAAKPADKPTKVPTGLAAPKPKTDEEISLEHKSKGLDDQMAQEGLSESQMEEWEETEEPKPLTAKRDAQREIAAAPGQYRQMEEQQLESSKKQADKTTGKELKNMATAKTKKTGDVFGGQQKKETETEKRQREIKEKIDKIYGDTETAVTGILNDLSTTVETVFSAAVEIANETFKRRVRSRLDDHYGWFTFDDKIAEWAGLSDGVAHIFKEEKQSFLDTLDLVLDRIATIVETEINKALDRIKLGRTQLMDFKKTLTTDELKYAEEMFAEATEKFSELETSVAESQDELIETLSDQYVESVNKLQEEFDKINEELSASWIADALSFIGEVATAIKKLGELLSSIVSRIGQYIGDILASPKRFFNNLVDGIKGGMDEFSDNIDTYLEQGFWMWLTGASSANKIEIPKTMDVEGMFSLAAQILGITKDFILARIKAVLKIPVDAFMEMLSKADSVVAKVMEPVKILLTQGIGALWVWVKNEISSKLDEIFGGLKTDIFQAIIKKFLLWVASLFIPGLGFIKLIQAAYKALRWLVDNIDRIVEIVNSFLDAIGLAVQGNVSAIKQKVVKALSNGVVIAIDFLAKLVGLGNFGDKLQRGIKKLQKPVYGAIDWILKKARPAVKKIQKAIAKGVKAVKRGVNKVKEKGKETIRKIFEWWKIRQGFKTKTGASHNIYFKGKNDSSELIIASNPMGLEQKIKERLSTETNPQSKAALNEALRLKNELSKYIREEEKAQKADPNRNTKQFKKEIESRLKAITDQLKMANLEDSELPPSNVSYSMLGNRAFSVKAGPLSKLPGNTRGSVPRENPEGWSVVQAMPDAEKNRWVKLHLLNHNLHGPGKKWNLTPGTKEINAQMEKEVESKAKEAVEAGKVVFYEVQVNYHDIKGQEAFPREIGVKFGMMENKGNGFEKLEAPYKPFYQPLPATALDQKPILNESSGARLAEVVTTVPTDVWGEIVKIRRNAPAFRKKGKDVGITTFSSDLPKFVNSNDFHSLMSVQAIQEGKERGYYNTHIGKIAEAGKNKQIILFER